MQLVVLKVVVVITIAGIAMVTITTGILLQLVLVRTAKHLAMLLVASVQVVGCYLVDGKAVVTKVSSVL
ncbi:hypothetical protein IJG22_03360 [Candidatus Saccharibacteria bacterium]|nr:hypothetical protein [Candidatus Saccharibacteria bacterium]